MSNEYVNPNYLPPPYDGGTPLGGMQNQTTNKLDEPRNYPFYVPQMPQVQHTQITPYMQPIPNNGSTHVAVTTDIRKGAQCCCCCCTCPCWVCMTIILVPMLIFLLVAIGANIISR